MNQVDELRAQVAELTALLADSAAAVPPEWRLTATEERIFRVLLAVDTASRQAIAKGASLSENRTIDVHIARIRTKVNRFGAEIETVRAKGWRLVNRQGWGRSLAPQAA